MRSCNLRAASIGKGFPEIGLIVDALKSELSLQQKEILTSDGVHGRMEQTEYKSINMVFSFMFLFAYRNFRYVEDEMVKNKTKIHSECLLEWYSNRSKGKIVNRV